MSLLALGGAVDDQQAVYDAGAGRWWTYGELANDVQRLAAELAAPRKALAFCFVGNDIASVIAYLAVLQAGHAVALLDRALPDDAKSALVGRYAPEFILDTSDRGAEFAVDLAIDYDYAIGGTLVMQGLLWYRANDPAGDIEKGLALLLTTSGSTGSPKFVQLSYRSVLSNATSIRDALDIDVSELAITSLPIYYSYGLSVLNSHLAAGARVVLTSESIITPVFWETFRSLECSSFAGVPYMYQMLDRIGFGKFIPPSLRTMTQAGGKLGDDLILRFHRLIDDRGGRFFVMYGQTEATARIAVLPPRYLPSKIGSVGFAVPGGCIRIDVGGKELETRHIEGEVVYTGPNVMYGYAMGREDLAKGDQFGGVLRTGDIGYLDDDGALRITGRSKRIAKVFGIRINLDEIEDLVRSYGPAAVIERNEKLVVFLECSDESRFAEYRADLAKSLRVHHSALQLRSIQTLPRTASGKLDYRALQES